MTYLTVESFLVAGSDPERAQYHVLAGLKSIRDEFSRTSIYPHLGDLIELREALTRLERQIGEIRDAIPTDIEGLDLENGEVVHAEPSADLGPVGSLRDLIKWAMPRIEEVIDEGRTIFEFVDASLRIEQVGILPGYTEEGYLMVPDSDAGDLCVLRYTMSIVTRAKERYRGLRTSVVKRCPDRKAIPPQHIKLDLVRERPDLPNPAAFYVETEIGFPFTATVMPIAKRKLMRHLFASAR